MISQMDYWCLNGLPAVLDASPLFPAMGLIIVFPKIMPTSECDLIQTKVFTELIEVRIEMRFYQVKVGPKSN